MKIERANSLRATTLKQAFKNIVPGVSVRKGTGSMKHSYILTAGKRNNYKFTSDQAEAIRKKLVELKALDIWMKTFDTAETVYFLSGDISFSIQANN